jgi:hypothetical protein
MNRLLTVIICGLVMAGLFMVIPPLDGESIPTRDLPDIRLVVNVPENGGSYQKELGLRVNVTLFNDGDDMGSSTGNLSLVLTNLETGQKVPFNFLPIQFSGIGPGENRSYQFPNWTGIFPGRFIANVSAHFINDEYLGNNYVENTFSVWSDEWIGNPELISKQVSPIRGNTSTYFTFKAEFRFNKIPNWVRVQVDDQVVEMDEDDPEDSVPNDGKIYSYTTRLLTGNHRYRFTANATGVSDITTPWTNSPWVNLSLKNQNVTPPKGYVTTPFIFSVDYGSEKAFPPSSIFIDTGSRTFNLTMSSPNPDYQGGRVEYSTTIKGIDLVPAPVSYYVRCESDGEEYSIGPFDLEGPNMFEVNVTGHVTDLKGNPLSGVLVDLDPGDSTITDAEGNYSMVTRIGPNFQIYYSKEGFLTRSYEIDIMKDRNLNIELEEVPVGGSISGYIKSPISGEVATLPGATVNISMTGYTNETVSSEEGYYLMEGIPAGTSYVLTVSEYRHETTMITVIIRDGEMTFKNITLTEKEMSIIIDPPDSTEAIPVDQSFLIEFPQMPDLDTVSVALENRTSTVPITVFPMTNTSQIMISPLSPLIYNMHYNLTLRSGVMDNTTGELLVWRDLVWTYVTDMQPMGTFVSDPSKDSLDVPLDQIISISFGIAIDLSTFSVSFNNMDTIVDNIQFEAFFNSTVLWNESGRSDTLIEIHHDTLDHSTRYSIEISSILKDIYGRNILEEPLAIEFTTVPEPDGDNDGVVDSMDAFPEDPNEWSDFDEDGVGDNSDKFPADDTEWADLDGDGIGDNADTDDDGDQIPDAWELSNGLDPEDPSDAFDDDDNDGYYNIEEYLEGTDPQDKSDHPEESSIFDTNLIFIITAIIIIVVIVIIAVLFMMGIIGGRKGESLEEE